MPQPKPSSMYQDSDRYEWSKNQLFERNVHGARIPRLRVYLISGSVDAVMHAGAPMPSLFVENEKWEKILLEGQDFSDKAYAEMSDYVFNTYITNQPDAVVWDTVLDWHRGQVIVPQNKEFLRILTPHHQEFGKWYYDFINSGDTANAYRIYTTLRSALMGYFAKLNPKAARDRAYSKGSGQLSIADEIEAIYATIGQEEKSEFVRATVIDVTQLPDGVSQQHRTMRKKQRNAKPYRGLNVNDSKPPQDYPVMDIHLMSDDEIKQTGKILLGADYETLKVLDFDMNTIEAELYNENRPRDFYDELHEKCVNLGIPTDLGLEIIEKYKNLTDEKITQKFVLLIKRKADELAITYGYPNFEEVPFNEKMIIYKTHLEPLCKEIDGQWGRIYRFSKDLAEKEGK